MVILDEFSEKLKNPLQALYSKEVYCEVRSVRNNGIGSV